MRTKSKYSRVDDVEGEEDQGGPEREMVAGVRLYDGKTTDNADTAVDYHAQTTEEHCPKSIPVAA